MLAPALEACQTASRDLARLSCALRKDDSRSSLAKLTGDVGDQSQPDGYLGEGAPEACKQQQQRRQARAILCRHEQRVRL